jgi:hypothetical protein
VATGTGDRTCLFIFDKDELFFDEPDAFRRWLDEHVHEFEGPTPLQQELLGHLLPGQVDPVASTKLKGRTTTPRDDVSTSFVNAFVT